MIPGIGLTKWLFHLVLINTNLKIMEKSQQDWSRRKFITTLTGTGAVIILNPLLSWTDEEVDPRVAAIVAKTIGIDTHNHIDVPLNASELPGPNVDLAGEMEKSGLSAICMTFAVDYQKLQNPGEAYDRFINGLNAMDKVLESNNMKRAMNLSTSVLLIISINQPSFNRLRALTFLKGILTGSE